MHPMPEARSREMVSCARAALAAFDQREADAVAAWTIFGEGPPPPLNQARRAELARAVTDAERIERRAESLPN